MKFRKPLVAVVSDTHFGIHQNSEVWHRTAMQFTENLKKELIKRGIQDIVIAGDIHHNRNEISVSTIHVVNEIFKSLKDFNIIIIPGNHDAYYKDRSDVHSLGMLDGWENIHVFSEPTSIMAFGRQISFCPWSSDFTKLPYSDIIFGHFAINNFKMVSGKTCDNGIESNDILKYGKLIMSGHFHASEIRKYSTGTIVYIGCPYEQDWGNYGDDKGFFTLDLNTMNYEFIVNNVTPKHKKLKLTELISAGEIPKYWSSEIYNNIVSFEVDRHIEPEKLTILCSKLQSMQPLSFKVDYNVSDNTTNELLSANINGIDIPTSIIEFVQLLDIDNKQEVIDYTIELYNNSTK